MSSAVNFFLRDYDQLSVELANELYRLRRKTFRDRLDWEVQCIDGMEKDLFDNKNTTYLLGVHDGQLLCGARFIDSTQPTMMNEIFHKYFSGVCSLPTDIPCCEITRLFLDKERRDAAKLEGLPASKALFLAMIVFCMKKNYSGMYAVVSRGMYAIFRHANWKTEVIQKGFSEMGEDIYYIFMPANSNVIEDIIIKDKHPDWLRDNLQHLRHL